MEPVTNDIGITIPGWGRAILALIVFFILTIIYHSLLYTSFGAHWFVGLPWLDKFTKWIGILLPAFLTVWLFRRYLDRQTVFSLGFSSCNSKRDFSLGAVAATLLFAVGFGVLLLLGEIRIVEVRFPWLTLVNACITFCFVALSEEVLCRGYILTNMMRNMNRYLALLVTALIFALMHLFNPGFTFFSFFNLFLAGVLLGASYIYTRNLWFPVSLHFFWNLFQWMLGFQVSGTSLDSEMVSLALDEKNIINGGDFGFEGSIVCTLLMLIAIFLVMRYYRDKS